MVKNIRSIALIGLLIVNTNLNLAQAAEVTTGYDQGFNLASSDGKFSLKLGGILAPNYQYQMTDGGTDLSGFNMNIARLKTSGNLYDNHWHYRLDWEFATGTAVATDAFLSWSYSPKFHVRAGNIRVPFGYEFLMEIEHNQFVTASILNQRGLSTIAALGAVPGYELGVVALGGAEDSAFHYQLSISNGATNGTGSFARQAASDVDLRYALRMSYDLMGHRGFMMGDHKKSSEPQLSVGVSGYYQRNDGDANGTFGHQGAGAIDLSYASNGLSLLAEFQHIEQTDGNVSDHGLNLQAGMFLTDAFEVAARGSWYDTESTTLQVMTGSLVGNYYFYENLAKLQFQYDLAYSDPVTPAAGDTDHGVTVQAQVAF